LFLAVDAPDDPAILALVRELRDIGRPIGAVRPENLHFTIRFLGDTPIDRVPIIEGVMRSALKAFWKDGPSKGDKGGSTDGGTVHGRSVEGRSFTGSISGTGAFPSMRRPRVLWLGMHGPVATALGRLEELLDIRLRGRGYSRDRPFQPHLTISRVRGPMDPDTRERVEELMERAGQEVDVPFAPTMLHLRSSDLTTKGPIYEDLVSVPLG